MITYYPMTLEAADGATPHPPSSIREAAVVELRRYLLRPDGFRELLGLFERHFCQGQADAGILTGGIFADEDHGDRFVWWRAFASLPERQRALEAFYYGPVWAQHRDRANATMVDSDDVLMLRPTDPAHAEPAARDPRTPHRDSVATMIVRHSGDADTERWLSTELHARLEELFGRRVSTWRTEPAQNAFPRLPVRSEPAFVASVTFPSAADRDARLERHADGLTRMVREQLQDRLLEIDLMRLQPTAISSHPIP